MNPVAEALTGWSLREARGLSSAKVFDIVHEHTRALVESPVQRVLREGRVVGLANHTVLVAKDGREIPIEDSGAPIRTVDGELLGVVLVFRDVSERQKVERSLIESERRFRDLANASAVLIWTSDANGDCTYFNRTWLQFTGRELADELGDGWLSSVHTEDRERCFATYMQAFERRQAFRMEYRLRRHDGVFRWMMDTGTPRQLENGEFAGYVGTCFDITERYDAESQLMSMNDLLERRVAERTRQLRRLASELTRTEQRERRRLAYTLHDNLQQLLAAARIRLDVLRRQEGMERMSPWVQQLEQLITQSIEASRTLTVELSPPVLYDAGLTAAIPWIIRRVGETHRLEVEAAIDAEAEPADEDVRVLLFEAVRELLNNAVTHGKADSARVTLDRVDDGNIRLTVQDFGVGFDPAIISETSVDHGFGLFHIRERLELFGGKLDIDSSVGEGTTVTLTVTGTMKPDHTIADAVVPAVEHARAPLVRSHTNGRTLRVLLVDDHKIVREGLSSLLAAEEGIEVVGEAADGLAAVEMTRKLRPHVVVMDVSMPRMNGVEATRLISEQAPETRVLGLSMHEETELREAILEAGAAAYLPKDGPVEALLEALRDAAPPADA